MLHGVKSLVGRIGPKARFAAVALMLAATPALSFAQEATTVVDPKTKLDSHTPTVDNIIAQVSSVFGPALLTIVACICGVAVLVWAFRKIVGSFHGKRS